MSVTHYLRRAVSMPPHKAVAKAAGIVRRRIDQAHRRRRDFTQPTFATAAAAAPGLLRYFRPLDVSLLRARRELIAGLAHRTLRHSFNLLGSGWVLVEHGTLCRGVEGRRYGPARRVVADREGQWLAKRLNRANLPAAQGVWQLINGEYTPIDWQLDFKSGWRWSERTWSQRIRYGHRPGIDVKVPWELARMQHLPWLAWAFALAADGDSTFDEPAIYPGEFRNQVLDFIATNPPRFGVNWCCTMDVGIRVANWLVAYDLFRAAGAVFDEPFERVFEQSILEHGRHIVGHLEWSPELRSNHYLANVAGLLFAAAWLPAGGEADEWLAFAVRELVRETELQFTADGANFEASTSYHRLSAEMVAWATAVALALPEDKQAVAGAGGGLIPNAHLDRLERMAEFTMAVTRPDGRVAQIGDNDSGRFLKLWPSMRRAADAIHGDSSDEWTEDGRDHRHLVAAINGLVDRDDFGAFAGDAGVETHIVSSLFDTGVAGAGRRSATPPMSFPRALMKQVPTRTADVPDCRGSAQRPEVCRPDVEPRPAHTPQDGSTCPSHPPRALPHASPQFGIYTLLSPRVWVALRAGPVGQNGNGGHAHNDQLSIELCLDGVPFVVDPGTYLYTPFAEARNAFRATAAHNTLVVAGREQNEWRPGPAGLFSMADRSRACVVRRTEREIVAEHTGYGTPHQRTIRLTPEGIGGRDECAVPGEKWIAFHFNPGVTVSELDETGLRLSAGGVHAVLRSTAARWSLTTGAFSSGYGEVELARMCRLHMDGPALDWSIALEQCD